MLGVRAVDSGERELNGWMDGRMDGWMNRVSGWLWQEEGRTGGQAGGRDVYVLDYLRLSLSLSLS